MQFGCILITLGLSTPERLGGAMTRVGHSNNAAGCSRKSRLDISQLHIEGEAGEQPQMIECEPQTSSEES